MQSASTLAAGIFVVTVGAYVLKEWDYLFTMPTRQLSRSIYGANPFVESPEIAKYIQSHTTANDRIAVLGSEPQIYFYANRKSATGYIYTYALMEQQKYSARMQDEMIQEVNAAQPKYIVYVTIPTSWLARSEKEKILTWSESYLNQCYNVVGLADMLSIDQTNWVWDANAAVYSPKSNYVVYTFEKKTNARCVAS